MMTLANGKRIGMAIFWLDDYDGTQTYTMKIEDTFAANVNGFNVQSHTLRPDGKFWTFYQIRCVQSIEPISIDYLYLSEGYNYIQFPVGTNVAELFGGNALFIQQGVVTGNEPSQLQTWTIKSNKVRLEDIR